MVTVLGMYLLCCWEGRKTWKWHRRLLGSEEEKVVEYSTLLHDFVLQDGVSDMWKCNIHTSQHCIVSSAYHCLTSSKKVTTQESSDIIWHKAVPLKARLFVWRRLQNRIPSTDNLLWRGFFKISNNFVWMVVDLMRTSITCFCILIILDQFGRLRETLKHHRSTMNLL